MDVELQDRWRAAQQPFDGMTLAANEGIPLCLLRAILARIISFLKARWPDARLYTLHDWHAHDGYLMDATATSWERLSDAVTSNDALCALCSDDTFVHTAVFPDDYGFYLRFGCVDECDRPPSADDVEWGDFDVTGPPLLVERIQALVGDMGGSYLVIERAQAFFDRTYAG